MYQKEINIRSIRECNLNCVKVKKSYLTLIHMENEELNWSEIKAKALAQFRTGKSLYGKDGAFAPLLKQFLEAALEEELNAHLDTGQREQGNRKNGKTSKRLKTDSGELEIESHVIATVVLSPR